MEGLVRDARLGLRALLRTPLLFATAILTLAAGTGLATGVGAVAYGILLRPLPYADPSTLVVLSIHREGDPATETGLQLPAVDAFRRSSRAFVNVAGHSNSNFTLRGAGDARSVRTTMVTAGFFDVLGLPATEGTTSNFGSAGPAIAMSAPLADAVGRQGAWRQQGVSIGPGHFGVAAILPRSFTFPTDRTELWLRGEAVPGITIFSSEDRRRFQLIARLKPAVTRAQAQDDARRVMREIAAAFPEKGSTPDVTVYSLEQRQREGVRAAVLPFAVGAGLVLVIACANVSSLLVGRTVAREREYAVRRALGSGAAPLVRGSLVESGIIALTGWALGLWVAHLFVRFFDAQAAGAIPNLQAVRLDATVVLASLVLAALVALVSGGAPALRALRTDPGIVLRHTSGGVGRSGGALRGTLVVVQIALTVVLLVCAGLLMRTVGRIMSADRGFDPSNAVALRLTLTQTISFEVKQSGPFIDRLVTRARELPGVVAAGVGSDLPPNGTQLMMTIRIVRENRNETFALSFGAVTPGYLEAIGVTVVAGRLFEEIDRDASPPSAVISESAARMMFEGQDAVGREWPATIIGRAGRREKPRIIGVVRDVKYGGLDRTAPATLFAPWDKIAPGHGHLVVRTDGNVHGTEAAMRRLVQELDPSLPLFTPQSLDDVVAGSLADRRLRLQLAGGLAALALALAAIALSGVMAQRVLDRRRELAVRLALGSTSEAAVRLVVLSGLGLVLLGVVAGLGAGAIAARTLRHWLHGIAPFDPLTFVAGAAVVVVVSLLACYVPARRVAAISPVELLREG